MIIEIHGGQLKNKGAFKMLAVTIRRLRLRFPEAELVVDACVGTEAELRDLGLKTLMVKRGWMGGRRFRVGFLLQRTADFFLRRIPRHIRRVILISDVDAVVDISGFAYTEQWGSAPAEDFASICKLYKTRGASIYLLPQAFGPFKNQELCRAVREIIGCSSQIYARDQESYRNLQDLSPSPKINKSPDITLFEGSKSLRLSDSKEVGIIPNMRMLDRSPEWQDRYIETLRDVCVHLRADGYSTTLFVHDNAGEDIKVAVSLREILPFEIEIFEEDDPWLLKDRISKLHLVIGSRYHGLVAALSCRIPIVVLGWAHKYKELLYDFDLEDHCIDPSMDISAIVKMVDRACSSRINNKLRQSIDIKLQGLLVKNETMWDSVTGDIASREGN